MAIHTSFLALETALDNDLSQIGFQDPVRYVHHPLQYARPLHEEYIETYLDGPKPFLFLGMNPGPKSSLLTGIPFGDADTVNNWMNINRDIQGEEYLRFGDQQLRIGLNAPPSSEQESGNRFHQVIKQYYPDSSNFFESSCVYNYCPIAFLNEEFNNVTPTDFHTRADNNLQLGDQKRMEQLCNTTLGKIIELLQVEKIIAFGQYANNKANTVKDECEEFDIQIIKLPHPSNANENNMNWVQETGETLELEGILP